MMTREPLQADLRRALLFGLVVLAVPAFAHTQTGVAGGLLSGLLHPVVGVDHLVAMVAVGLWGAILGAPSIWVLPVAFPVIMALGALAGLAGLSVPGVEFGIAASALALGAAVLIRARPPIWIAAALVAVFAVFHGHAHGTEIPDAANPLAYGVGFVLATGLLHAVGILLGLLVRWPAGLMLVRGCGALIAGIGAWFLAAAFA